MQGYKSATEKFAGSLYSSSIEGFVPVTGRGIQAGTSHALGQNFSKMFGIEYEAQDKTSQLAWQTSWGLSTRSIGVMIMVHGDDKVRPWLPLLAQLCTIVYRTFDEDAGNWRSKCENSQVWLVVRTEML